MADYSHTIRVTTATVDGVPVARVSGEVDLRTSPQLREHLLDLARRGADRVLVDLSAVPYMDSSGVGTMVFVKREIERAGGRLILVGLQPRVRSVFEITNLQKFFNIAQSVEEVTGT